MKIRDAGKRYEEFSNYPTKFGTCNIIPLPSLYSAVFTSHMTPF